MGNFNSNYSNRRSFSGGQSEYKQMHKATCSNCGRECEVPFKPNGSRPVLCRDCFRNNNSSFEGGRNENRSFERRSFENRAPTAPVINYVEQFKDLNRKLDKIMAMLASVDVAPVEKIAVEESVVNQEKEKTVKKKPTSRKK